MVILQWEYLEGFIGIMICNSKGAAKSVCPPSTTTFASVKSGEATCLLSSNPGDSMFLDQRLEDNRYIGPAVKHDPNRYLRAIALTEFHVDERAKPNLQWRWKFSFLCQIFF